MRSLIFLFLSFMMSNQFVYAFYVETSLSASESSPLNFDQNSNAKSTPSFSSRFTAGEVNVYSALTFNQIIEMSRIDNYQFGFLDQSQNENYKKNSISYNVTGNTQLNYTAGLYSSVLGFLYPISNSLVKQYGVQSIHSLDFFNKSTVVGMGYEYLMEKRPLSYFLDFDFTVKRRPDVVNAHEVFVFYEQILSEKFKFRTKAYVINKPEERPDALGAETLFAFAPWNSHILKIKGLYAKELENQSLKNERGYFRLLSFNLAWDYEYNYGTLLGLSYNYQREDEKNPRNLTTRILGLDSVSAFFEKKIMGNTVKISGDYSRSNLKSNFWGTTISLRRDL